jgi:hypothetical protein
MGPPLLFQSVRSWTPSLDILCIKLVKAKAEFKAVTGMEDDENRRTKGDEKNRDLGYCNHGLKNTRMFYNV